MHWVSDINIVWIEISSIRRARLFFAGASWARKKGAGGVYALSLYALALCFLAIRGNGWWRWRHGLQHESPLSAEKIAAACSGAKTLGLGLWTTRLPFPSSVLWCNTSSRISREVMILFSSSSHSYFSPFEIALQRMSIHSTFRTAREQTKLLYKGERDIQGGTEDWMHRRAITSWNLHSFVPACLLPLVRQLINL